MTKEQIINYFKELGDNIPNKIDDITIGNCEGYCPFYESCGRIYINLCDIITYPKGYIRIR